MASLQVAGIIGFFAFFAPAGIGVREGLLLALLHGTIPDPALALAVVLLRANQILVEVTLALIGWVSLALVAVVPGAPARAVSPTPVDCGGQDG
jgi:uncharacterized membrane protein YbhN (UPF0104 family)